MFEAKGFETKTNSKVSGQIKPVLNIYFVIQKLFQELYINMFNSKFNKTLLVLSYMYR